MSSSETDSDTNETKDDTRKEEVILPEKNVPADIKFESIIETIDFHPKKEFLASGNIDGDVTVHSYSINGKNHEVLLFCHHKRACRAAKFSSNGNFLFTGSKDKSIAGIDMTSGVLLDQRKGAHSAGIYSILPIDDFLMASGDDKGIIKIWDYRRRVSVIEFEDCSEYISDLAMDRMGRTLLATSGEGTLTAYNIRAKRMEMQSELMDSELQSVAVIKNGRKVVTGMADGVINIFNWGEWGNICDRFPTKLQSIDSIIPISETVICTGSMDGKLRAVSINPNMVIGVIGRHESFPIEGLSKSYDDELIASVSHDEKIKFWNISDIEDPAEGIKRKERKKLRKKKQMSSSDNFFADLNS